jgi:hypothetical protein
MHYVQYNLIICATLCIAQAFLNACQPITTQKPTIEGIIQIRSKIAYASTGYSARYLESIGYGNNDASIPLILVRVLFKEDGFYHNDNKWVTKEPTIIKEYEPNKHDTDDRKFPMYIPISLVHYAKEGDVLSLTVHGYPAHLICSNTRLNSGINHYDKSTVPAENHFELKLSTTIKEFIESAFYLRYDDPNIALQELLEKQIVKMNNNMVNHGEKGYPYCVPMITLPLVLQQSLIKVVMLLWPFRHETG